MRPLGSRGSGSSAPRTLRATGGLIGAVLLLAALLSLAGAQSATAQTIPSNFFVLVDQQGPNDVNAAQADLSQLGRDDSNSSVFKLFWSWDSISSWTSGRMKIG